MTIETEAASAGADEAAFRKEARAWLEANAPRIARETRAAWSEAELVAYSLAWQRTKAQAGYALIPEAPELGGRNGAPWMEAVFAAEERRFDPPTFVGLDIAFGMALPVIKRHGTAEQYRRFARPTAFGEAPWCQLFSEPGAGSDLAAVRTKAERRGDDWIVNGQKVWSSWAHHARFAILLARTDPSVVKHKGLSFFVVDMGAPGVDVRPIRQITGKSDFNETFLTDVALPDADRIGAEGEGWACAMTVLMNERDSSADSFAVPHERVLSLIAAARSAGRLESTAVRAKLARWWVEEQGLRLYSERIQAAKDAGQPPPAAVAMMKLVAASKMQQINAFLMDLGEYGGLFAGPMRPQQEEVFFQYLWSTALRIAGGADEILRNQLAERVLGMPSEPRLDKVPFNELPGVR
jgi:alkylation response protein AidB-like acyl-CoA dehydrogenase